jgi:hypothetical protein
MNSFAISILAVVAFRLKMDAEETSVVWLDQCTEQQTFRNQSARTHRVGVHFATEIHTVLAYTKAPMRSTRSYSGQYLVQSVAHRGLLLRVERVHGAYQNFERIARNHLMTFVRQAERNASPIRLGSLSD